MLIRRRIISHEGLDALSKLVVEITMPLFVLTQLILRFNFSLYPKWYILPFVSALITLGGFVLGWIMLKFSSGKPDKNKAFISLIGFQNSGYLVFPLIITLLPKDAADSMLIYLFLFLLGFNLTVWSVGAYLLSSGRSKRFEMGSLFTPVVGAILAGLLIVILRVDRIIPDVIIRPFKLIGECTIPLAMIVVGGNLALIDFSASTDRKLLFNVVLAKLILLPVLALAVIFLANPAYLIGLLIIIEAAVPSATSLSVISRHYKSENIDFIGQGIFWTHILSIFTIPVFISLFSVISRI